MSDEATEFPTDKVSLAAAILAHFPGAEVADHEGDANEQGRVFVTFQLRLPGVTPQELKAFRKAFRDNAAMVDAQTYDVCRKRLFQIIGTYRDGGRE